ncbi:osmotic avoidance abnormal protein 3 [Drosophila kikkawai]|uniref:Kinesin-like protein n=1 Tax=Drosophila kikkawai TaxID=30033 RepID=A0ABM4GM10_DROKI|nr:osmotic avoidance abnormal protein 3 isoform X2 [Drosophila kikkawai]
MSENIKAVVRCRPMNRNEIESKFENIVDIKDYSVSVLNPLARLAQKKVFTFDSVYNMNSKTEAIYNEMCYSLVESTIEGYNGTIFAYGQTGCGKTHTMQGTGNMENTMRDGIIPKCFDHIFEAISMATNVRYLAFVSYFEIYNENIRDLLVTASDGCVVNHPLKDIPGIGVTVPTLSSQPVINAMQCYRWLNVGNQNCITAATLMNENSSRSHTIFTITLEQSHNFTKNITSEDADLDPEILRAGIRRGKLNLVDLAGSERQGKTGAQGERLREATKINLSLSALGNVISSLVNGKTKYVPFRDSKLTRLLQDSLGGNTKTLMISCISPSSINYDETITTLRYASRAKKIANKPTINEDPKDAKIRQYQNEILYLKKKLEEKQQNIDNRTDEKLGIRISNNAKKDQEAAETTIAEAMNLKSILLDQSKEEEIQFQAQNRIDLIKRSLIGGERVGDLKLKEQHKARRIAAQRHLNAVANALNRVNYEDRDLLQGHYANIAQEINIKNEYIQNLQQKIKMLEMEVSDLNSEFQLDREDYLDEIRNLGRCIKFYQQLVYKFGSILRKNYKNWSPDIVMEHSTWNDDLKTWKIPDNCLLKLPPTNINSDNHRIYSSAGIKNSSTNFKNDEKMIFEHDNLNLSKEKYNVDVLKNYFRTSRPNNNKEQFRKNPNCIKSNIKQHNGLMIL